MNFVDQKLSEIKNQKRFAVMTHLVVGYPSLKDTAKLITVMEQSGADFIELQIPFSDPLADGPTIMRACEKALDAGVKVADSFKLAKQLSSQIKVPVLFMAYFNTVFKYGVRKFCQNAKAAGISGLIVPDMPIEEEKEEHFSKYCKESGLKNIHVISPAATLKRLKKNAKVADGFIYCTARQGITGTKKELDPKVIRFLKKVRKYFKVPIAVGFGISSRQRIEQIEPYSDIAVVGSAILDVINESKSEDLESNVTKFIESLRQNPR